MQRDERPGITIDGHFYVFSRHLIHNRTIDKHPEATDARLVYVIRNPDIIDPPEGSRQVLWKYIHEPEVSGWWMKVVLDYRSGSTEILTAYEDETGEGQRKWNAMQNR